MKDPDGIFNKFDPWLFFVVVIINLLPALLVKYFLTVDGPSHLYNSKLMAELLTNPEGPLSNYFILQKLLTTNITDHYLFLLSGYFYSGHISEKILVMFYLIGLPFAFRYFILSINPSVPYLAYMIFPFTYSFLFFYGFYNFHIALVFFFIALGYHRKFCTSPGLKTGIVHMILITIICISHVFVLGIFLLVLVIIHSRNFIQFKSDIPNDHRKKSIRMLLILALAITPSLILMLIISLNSQSPDLPNEYIPFIQRLKWIRQIQPAKGIVYEREDIYTTWLFILLMILTIITLFQMFYPNFEIERKPFRFRFKRTIYRRPQDRWLLISFIILILYFVLPDSYHGYWSFVSSRLLLFFFLILIAWIASRELLSGIKLPVLLIILVLNSFLLSIYFPSVTKNNRAASEVEKASILIPPYSTVLPVNGSGNWIYGHLSNYLGIDKPLIILENYEAELDYFPVSWNHVEMPEMLFGKMNSPGPCLSWQTNPDNDPEVIDFIFLIRNTDNINDSCIDRIDEVLSRDYKLIFSSDNKEFELYRLKSILE